MRLGLKTFFYLQIVSIFIDKMPQKATFLLVFECQKLTLMMQVLFLVLIICI